MPMTAGQAVTWEDLQAMADAANVSLAMPEYDRTIDPRIGVPPDPPTIVGLHAISPLTPTPPRYAWRDELDRMWCALWDGGGHFSATAGVVTKALGYEHLAAWWAAGQARRVVAGVGPNLWTTTKDGGLQAFGSVKLIWSTMENPDPFTIYGGIMFGQVTPIGPSSITLPTLTPPAPVLESLGADLGEHHGATLTDCARRAFDVNLPSGTNLRGKLYFLFERTTGTAASLLTIDAASGFYFNVSGGTTYPGTPGYTIIDDDHIAVGWYSTSLADVLITDICASGTGTEKVTFFAYLNHSGWRWAGTYACGVAQWMSAASVDGVVTSEKVIHPRNESLRSITHLSNATHLVLADLLDVPGLVGSLTGPVPAYAPSAIIRGKLTAPTQANIDAYPVGWDVGTFLGEMNTLVIDGANLFLTGAWDALQPMRPVVEWLIRANPPAGSDLCKMLNRLLIEEAYPAYIRRQPTDDTEPENEILELSLASVSLLEGSPAYYFCPGVPSDEEPPSPPDPDPRNTLPAGYMADIDFIGLYLASAWPQPFFHCWLDLDLPNYQMPAPGFLNSVRKFRYIQPEGFVNITGPNQPARWPVHRDVKFGLDAHDLGFNYPGEVMGMVPYQPNDGQTWQALAPADMAAGGVAYYTITIPNRPNGSVLESTKMEFGVKNDGVTVYVSNVDFPDPATPASYLFSKANGIVFPDDFLAASLLPDTYENGPLHITVKNTSGTAQTISPLYSVLTSRAAEDPPRPEPRFFGKLSPYDSDSRLNRAQMEPTGVVDKNIATDAYLFTMSDDYNGPVPAPGTGYPTFKNFMRPTRGYCVSDLLIKRMPRMNPVGIMEPDHPPTEVQVKIGVMAGSGVIAGAVYGCYPGQFIEFETVIIPAGESELRWNTFYPVLQGCPLAYQCAEEVIVLAAVNFQPAVNVDFQSAWVVVPVVGGDQYFRTGTYSGYPRVQRHFGFAWNLADPDYGVGGGMVVFPRQAAAFQDLKAWLDVV